MKNFINIARNYVRNNAVLKNVIPVLGSAFAGVLLVICIIGVFSPQATTADFSNKTNASYVAKATNQAQKSVKKIRIVATAYSSTPDQTDDSPFITASGKYVADGIIANNLLPFGTKVKIPDLYGDKVFIVEDRMNQRMGDHRVDIWMETRPLAVNFGVRTAEMEILEN